jgi:hypothetical protein
VVSKEPVVHAALENIEAWGGVPHVMRLGEEGQMTEDPAKATCPICRRAMADLLLVYLAKDKQGGPVRMALEGASRTCNRMGRWLWKMSRRV